MLFRRKTLSATFADGFVHSNDKCRSIVNFLPGAVILAFCSIFLLSCRKEVEPSVAVSNSSKGKDIIMASSESPVSTRLKLSESDTEGVYDMVWSDGDAITVVGSDSKTTDFSLSSGSGTSLGTFTGDLSAAGAAPHYAVFPNGRSAAVSGGSITFSIPKQISAQAGNVAKKTIPAVALLNDDNTVCLRNIFGLLKITITSSTTVSFKKIVLHDLGGNMLWGTCSVPLKDGVPDYENVSLSGGDNSITMLWNGSVTLSEGVSKSYYFAVPPGSLGNGFSFVFYEKDDSCTGGVGRAYTFIQKISDPVTAERSVIIDMDEISLTEKSEPYDESARGYYKSLFVDGGMRLNSYYSTSTLPWIKQMGLGNDYEYFACDTLDVNREYYQTGVLVSAPQSGKIKWNDANGVLLYPDGSPRFRAVYVNGGKSSRHGYYLGTEGRSRFHDFYYNGGSYVGTCAGAFLASTYVGGLSDKYNKYNGSNEDGNYTFGIWPGTLYHTNIPVSITSYETCYTGMKVISDFSSGGYSFSTGDTLEHVRQHGGCYLPHKSMNKRYPHEELMTYQYTQVDTDNALSYTAYNRTNQAAFGSKTSMVDSVSTFAYKASSSTGRAVLTGSHPERISSGKQLEWMIAMMSYALEGTGEPAVKGDLTLGQTRTMDKETSDGDPLYTRIGDRQYHHFKFTNTADIEDFTLTLASDYDSDSGINLYLTMRKGGYAWMSDADYVLTTGGGNKTFNIGTLPSGEWYIGVYCATTVTATATSVGSNVLKFFTYTGATEVLDGIAYSITASSGAATKSLSPGCNTGSLSFDD